MSDKKERSQVARPNAQGRASFDWQLTHTSVNDTVRLIMPPTNTLPVIFVPGIMGSNLKDTKGGAVWRLDAAEFSLGETKMKIDQPVNLAKRWATKKARPNILNLPTNY